METECTAFFAGEDRTFFLPVARVVVVEHETDASIFQLFDWLGKGLGAVGEEVVLVDAAEISISQCHSLIRNGLIGGGLPEKEAGELVKVYAFPARPAIYDLALAWEILQALVYGVRLKKKAEDAAESLSPSIAASSSSIAEPSASTGKRRRSART